MTTYLVIMSLLLHGVTLLWILTLMQRNSRFEDEKKNLVRMKDEMEELLFSYTSEMKEDNERLLKELKASMVQKSKKNELLSQQQPNLYKKIEDVQIKKVPPRSPVQMSSKEEHQYDDYIPPNIDETNEDAVLYEQSDTAKVVALAKQGLTADIIAKNLNLGKGEVELMIKFYR